MTTGEKRFLPSVFAHNGRRRKNELSWQMLEMVKQLRITSCHAHYAIAQGYRRALLVIRMNSRLGGARGYLKVALKIHKSERFDEKCTYSCCCC